MKKKILFLITKSNFGGAQRYVYELASALPKDSYDVSVAFGGTGARGAVVGVLKEYLDTAKIRTHTLTNFARDINLATEVRAFFEVLALIRREKPDVLHVNSSKAAGLGSLAGRLAGVQHIIFTAHGWPHQEERPRYQKLLIYLASWFSVLLAHETIVVSRADFKSAPSLFRHTHIHHIPNGIQPFALQSREDARRELSTATEANLGTAFLIGTISELTKNKGLDIAIHALSKISDVHFVVIGSGEERGRLELLARNVGVHDRVHFAGFIPNARRLLKAFDVYSLTSRKEGLPYTLLEAGYAGLPVVASHVGGIPDIIDHSTSGHVVRKNSARELSQAYTYIREHHEKAEAYGSALKTRVETLFNFESMVSKTRALY